MGSTSHFTPDRHRHCLRPQVPGPKSQATATDTARCQLPAASPVTAAASVASNEQRHDRPHDPIWPGTANPVVRNDVGNPAFNNDRSAVRNRSTSNANAQRPTPSVQTASARNLRAAGAISEPPAQPGVSEPLALAGVRCFRLLANSVHSKCASVMPLPWPWVVGLRCRRLRARVCCFPTA
jgi:hypothetical protein